ncbi:hypothetical protein IV203_020886 [Nitzschia inconspicua]|uniref:Uncharacterized protein n=1 Tax=Nitzschia inconspicua TaxID=303405 RepID=A0A9K3PDR3_9STRA|nr:hypothetical protein IV203_020886 [Nitzschia inconspicua]
MGYLSSSASVSSSYSTSRGVQFKDREDVLAMVMDNKYLKRRSQMQRQRLHDSESSICGGVDSCCTSVNYHSIFHLTTNSGNRKVALILLVVLVLSLCSFLFLAGWLTANYSLLYSTQTEEKSLQDLAESIRRMRLRRQKAALGGGSEDLFPEESSQPMQVDRTTPKRLGHRYYNDMDPPIPPDELELLKRSEAEAKRMEQLEARIRATQDRQINNEMKEKRLEDKMAESIQALKAFAYQEAAQKDQILEEESFKGRRKINK